MITIMIMVMISRHITYFILATFLFTHTHTEKKSLTWYKIVVFKIFNFILFKKMLCNSAIWHIDFISNYRYYFSMLFIMHRAFIVVVYTYLDFRVFTISRNKHLFKVFIIIHGNMQFKLASSYLGVYMYLRSTTLWVSFWLTDPNTISTVKVKINSRDLSEWKILMILGNFVVISLESNYTTIHNTSRQWVEYGVTYNILYNPINSNKLIMLYRWMSLLHLFFIFKIISEKIQGFQINK